MEVSLLGTVQTLVADTVVTRPARDPIALVSDIAILVAATAMVVLAVSLLRFLAEWRGAVREVRLTVRQNLGPVSDRARAISDNVEFITQAIRNDVARLNESVKSLTDRLRQASDHMEERIDEFNALMEVVQDEAEGLFLDTASTVRGVREGARALGRPRPRIDSDPPPASDVFGNEDGESESDRPDREVLES